MNVPTYDGQSDPARFLSAFHIGMQMFHFPAEDLDAAYCKLFVGRLTDAALQWFSRLEANSVDSYDVLTTAFLKHYSIHIQDGVSDADLYTLQQEPKESLRFFIDRFKSVASQIAVGDNAAVSALKNSLWHESPLKDKTKAIGAKKYASQPQAKATPAKEKSQEKDREPRQHYDSNLSPNYKGKQASNFQIDPPKPKRNKYIRPSEDTPSGEERPYCDHHKFYGHSTEQCRQLQEHLYNEYQSSGLM
ncbi:unnamed protein product [Microthlaspi erraticum]|uniref:Retrotransposon gag domain-containing protein n=1 Tax=Microthlaspi erraticum TaxID=1685480 RepID=A0A6D2KIV1_9BRAS|nr:unnamed protein product [Microthlaspi erraticum]